MGLIQAILITIGILIIVSLSSLLLILSEAAVFPSARHLNIPKPSSYPKQSTLEHLDSICRLTPNPHICQRLGILGGNPEEALIFADFSADAIRDLLLNADQTVLDICNKTNHQSTCVHWYYSAVSATAASSGQPSQPAEITTATVLDKEIRATKDFARGFGAELVHLHKNAKMLGLAGKLSAEYGNYGQLFKRMAAEMEAAEEVLILGEDMEKVEVRIRKALAYNEECKEGVGRAVAQIHAEAQFSSVIPSEANLSVLSQWMVKLIRNTNKMDVVAGICMSLASQLEIASPPPN